MVWIFKSKKAKKEKQVLLTDEIETLDTNAEIRRIKRQIKIEQAKLELENARAELMEFRDATRPDYEEPEEESPEKMMTNMAMQYFMMSQQQKMQSQQTPPPVDIVKTNESQAAGVTLNFETMQNIWKKLPKFLRSKLKSSDDEEIKRILLLQEPNLTTESQDLAIEFIKGQ